ncbi:hypothetical protein EOL96_01380 [Candidatus Saccharibacteria bacterium]|nr:hypothetical protein [Candidatus Saccharibacteria bacterium]
MSIILSLAICVVVVGTLPLAYGKIGLEVNKAKFIFWSLISLGTVSLMYPLTWVAKDQFASFSLQPYFTFGAVAIFMAFLYAALKVASLKDKAPSR